MVSIDHSIGFHRPFDFENWILFAMESPVTAGSRTLASASMFTQEGILIGSTTQEGLMRDLGQS